MTPDEIAARVVAAFTGDEYRIDKDAAIEDVAAALCAYGDARSTAERERCAALCEDTARARNDRRIGVPHSGEDAAALLDIAAAIRANADTPRAAPG